MSQLEFQKQNWKHKLSCGGELRKLRAGRGARPLSAKEPLHLVLKARREVIRGGLRSRDRYPLIHQVIKRYSKMFFIKIEQCSIQNDHIHLLIRTSRRSNYQSFFRVVAGQIAQRFENEGLLSVTGAQNASGRVTDTSVVQSSKSAGMTDLPTVRGRPAKVTDTPAVAAESSVATAANTALGTVAAANVATVSGSAKPKFWLHRPFSRVVRGWRAYKVVQAYIKLNELEARGIIPYKPARLRGLFGSSDRVYLFKVLDGSG